MTTRFREEHVPKVRDALPTPPLYASEDSPGRTTRGNRCPIQPLPTMVYRAQRKPAVRARLREREMHR